MTYKSIVKMFLLLPIIVFGLCSASPKPQQQEIEQPQVAKEVDKKQLQCLADNIYYEAGGEPIEGKAAVARVVLNRVNHGFANTPCNVVYQTTKVKQINEETEETFWVKVCQFSWVCEGKKNPNRDSHRYQTSLQVAKDVLQYDKYKEVIPKSVLFFHNTSVKNTYPHTVVKRIGNHIFYHKKHGKSSKKSGQRFVQHEQLSGKNQGES